MTDERYRRRQRAAAQGGNEEQEAFRQERLRLGEGSFCGYVAIENDGNTLHLEFPKSDPLHQYSPIVISLSEFNKGRLRCRNIAVVTDCVALTCIGDRHTPNNLIYIEMDGTVGRAGGQASTPVAALVNRDYIGRFSPTDESEILPLGLASYHGEHSVVSYNGRFHIDRIGDAHRLLEHCGAIHQEDGALSLAQDDIPHFTTVHWPTQGGDVALRVPPTSRLLHENSVVNDLENLARHYSPGIGVALQEMPVYLLRALIKAAAPERYRQLERMTR